MRTRLILGVSVLWIPLAFLFDGVTVLMLPLRLGGDATSLGLVSLVGLSLGAGLQPVAGWASDRLRQRVDRRLFIALALAPALLGLAVLVGTVGAVAAIAGYVLVQAAAASMQAGQQTLIPEHVDAARRGRAAGWKGAFDVGGGFLAFLVLGVLLAQGGLVAAAVVTAVVLLVGVLLVLVLVPPTAPALAARPVTGSMPPGFIALVLARLLFLFGTYAVGRFLVLLVGERMGLAPGEAAGAAGALLAGLTLATAIAALIFGRLADHYQRRQLMVLGSLVSAAGILLLVPRAGVPPMVAGGLLMSVGTGAFTSANWAATTDLVPIAEAGRWMGVANLGTGLAAAAAGLLGPLIDASGFAPALLIAAAASAAASLPLAARVPQLHRVREDPA